MNIIKNVKIGPDVKFEIDSISLFRFIEENLLQKDYELETFIFNYIFSNEKEEKLCCEYIENILNIKHKKKQIEYRHWSDNNNNITKFEIVDYFTDDDLLSYEDFFIDLADRTYDIISELYYDYINISDMIKKVNPQ